jgi:tetratricopeptide (TPR) repeat protein
MGEEAIQVGRRALAVAEALGLEDLRANILTSLGVARVRGGDPAGVADMEQGVAIAVAANSPDVPLAYGNLASVLIAHGNLAGGFELQAKARQAAERFGKVAYLRWLWTERVFQDFWQGRWDAALAGADQFIAAAQADAPSVMETSCRLVRGWIRLARSELPGARQDADAGLNLASAAEDLEVLYPALACRAHVLLAAGESEQAAAQASELLAVVTEQGALITTPDWAGELAIVLHTLGRGIELIELVDRLMTPTLWLQAATAIATGEFEQAAELYAQIGSLPDEAFARLQAAKQLLATGHRAEAYAQLQPALAFYRQVGATGYLGEGEIVLAATA